MALATQCPHCGTMFRVASDQLKLRGGIVRCGACQEIFDGSATLVDLDALPARAPIAPKAAAPSAAAPAAVSVTESATASATASITAPAAAPAAAPDTTPAAGSDAASDTAPEAAVPEAASVLVPAPAEAAETDTDSLSFTIVDGPAETSDADTGDTASATPNFDEQPVYTLDFDHTFDPFGILPKADAPDEAAAQEAKADADPPVADAGETATAGTAPSSEPAPAETAPLADVTAPAAQADAIVEPGPAEALPAQPQSPEPAAANAAPAVMPAAPARMREQKPAGAPAQGRIEPSFGLTVDEELVALPPPDHEPDSTAPATAATARAADAPPLPMREAAASVINAHAPTLPSAPPVARTPAARRAEKAAARRSRLTPTRIDAPPKIRVPEADEPEFVRRSRQQEQSGRTRKIAMLAGSVLLLLLLVAQGAVTFRNALAARFPAAKPALESSCAMLGCRVELPARIDDLVIETGELTTLGGGAYAFTTLLRNQGATVQAWPSLELSLTDANDKPLVRRVFAPRDYLGTASSPAAAGLAPRVEQAIKLHFRVDDLQPSGYHIAVFYP